MNCVDVAWWVYKNSNPPAVEKMMRRNSALVIRVDDDGSTEVPRSTPEPLEPGTLGVCSFAARYHRLSAQLREFFNEADPPAADGLFHDFLLDIIFFEPSHPLGEDETEGILMRAPVDWTSPGLDPSPGSSQQTPEAKRETERIQSCRPIRSPHGFVRFFYDITDFGILNEAMFGYVWICFCLRKHGFFFQKLTPLHLCFSCDDSHIDALWTT